MDSVGNQPQKTWVAEFLYSVKITNELRMTLAGSKWDSLFITTLDLTSFKYSSETAMGSRKTKTKIEATSLTAHG